MAHPGPGHNSADRLLRVACVVPGTVIDNRQSSADNPAVTGIHAILFDIGGPIDTEATSERLIDRDIRAALAGEGFAITDEEFQGANERCIRAFAPNLYHALVWDLTGHDAAASERIAARLRDGARSRLEERGGYEIRAGIPELLGELVSHGFLLGLAANQPAYALEELERAGLLHYFRHRGVSATEGFRKPDVRLFLAACNGLGVEPREAIMVGDRVDNDICPAKTLGMQTILFRTGRHREQQPRSWEEVADAEVHDADGLRAAIDELTNR